MGKAQSFCGQRRGIKNPGGRVSVGGFKKERSSHQIQRAREGLIDHNTQDIKTSRGILDPEAELVALFYKVAIFD